MKIFIEWYKRGGKVKSIYLKEEEIITLSFTMFKRVFGDEKDTKPIKFLIKAILDINVEDIKIYNRDDWL